MTDTHSRVDLDHPLFHHAYMSHLAAKRLVLFVHGFNGSSVGTWSGFGPSGASNLWWAESDMVFADYDSLKDDVTGVADRLRRFLPDIFPDPAELLLKVGKYSVREIDAEQYTELILVGHSLGGLVLRRALVDSLQDRILRRVGDVVDPRQGILSSKLRLFSPASAGFRPSGLLGMVSASSAWVILECMLRRSPSYLDLKPGSSLLEETRRRTQTLVDDPEWAALRASIVWANPDGVVIPERYDTDEVPFSLDGRSHRSVCKPDYGYEEPRTFIETGRPW